MVFQWATAECRHSEGGKTKGIETWKLYLILLMDKLIVLYQIYMFIPMIMLKTATMDCGCADTLHFAGKGEVTRLVCGQIIRIVILLKLP